MHGREVKGRYHRREGKHSLKDREMGMRYGRDGRGGGCFTWEKQTKFHLKGRPKGGKMRIWEGNKGGTVGRSTLHRRKGFPLKESKEDMGTW